MTETMTVTIDFLKPMDLALLEFLTFHNSSCTNGNTDIDTLWRLVEASMKVHRVALAMVAVRLEIIGVKEDESSTN
jgi:hypothetical protein